MKLGEMLIRDGRISEEQLHDALDQQRRTGGRVGTVMVEMGIIDVDTLTVYLGLELGIPIASGAALERAKKLAVRLLSPEQAAHYKIVPLLIQDRQLIAAVDDPYDMQGFDEILRITGYRVVPRVAPEIRIYYYLERFYGVARPARFMSFGDMPRGNHKPAEDLPAPPLPGLPPVNTEKVQAPVPAPELRTLPMGTGIEDDYEELDLADAELLVELEADDTAPAMNAPPPDASGTMTLPAREDEKYEPLDLTAATTAMEGATNRNEIAKALMGHATQLFDLAALFIVRDNMAFGWKVHSEKVDQDRIETLLVPLSVPSLLQIAVAADDQRFVGTPFPATIHKYMYKVLRTQLPDYAVARAISIGRRVVNIVYGHRQDGLPLEPDALAGLSGLCDAAARAYVRMIASSKARRREPETMDAEGDTVVDTPAPASDFDEESTVVGKRSARKTGESDSVGEEE